MAAGLYNLTLRQGSTFRDSIQLFDGDLTDEDTAAIDLNGCLARMQIRRSIGASTPLFSFTSDDEGLSLNVDNSSIEIELPAVTTAALTFRSAVYDLEVEFPDGTVIPVVEGRVTVDREVTR